MPPARPQQMSDPADKSDDLIAELAKLMAAPTGGSKPAVQPIARPAPIDEGLVPGASGNLCLKGQDG